MTRPFAVVSATSGNAESNNKPRRSATRWPRGSPRSEHASVTPNPPGGFRPVAAGLVGNREQGFPYLGARLHDAGHTAATMLLVLKVPVRAVMDVMGWSEASMATRYLHVPDELKREIANQVAGLLWSSPTERLAPENDEPIALTDDQRAAIRLIASALPPDWQRRFAELLNDDGDDPAGVPIPA